VYVLALLCADCHAVALQVMQRVAVERIERQTGAFPVFVWLRVEN
jgi:hypothetical protein